MSEMPLQKGDNWRGGGRSAAPSKTKIEGNLRECGQSNFSSFVGLLFSFQFASEKVSPNHFGIWEEVIYNREKVEKMKWAKGRRELELEWKSLWLHSFLLPLPLSQFPQFPSQAF
jgi:hypothetical protein